MAEHEKTILCLCHDEMTLRVRQLLLEYFGFRVLTTESAEEMSNLIRHKCPNVLLMDDGYPGIDYKWAAAKAKSICPEILAVVLVNSFGLRNVAEGPVDRFLNLDGPREEWLSEIEALLATQGQQSQTADNSA